MTLEEIRSNNRVQLALGLLSGIAFGFLLQKGGVTNYATILGQLLLTDFTVVKVMLSAILVGMLGIYALKAAGLVRLHTKPGSVGATVIGGLIFGAGFALLGYARAPPLPPRGPGRWTLLSAWRGSCSAPASLPGSTLRLTAQFLTVGPSRKGSFPRSSVCGQGLWWR